MAIETFYSVEENGLDYAWKKARMLVEEYGYRRIVSVSHCQIPQWGSLSTPYAGNYGKTEIGYKIEVDDGRPTYDPIIPESW